MEEYFKCPECGAEVFSVQEGLFYNSVHMTKNDEGNDLVIVESEKESNGVPFKHIGCLSCKKTFNLADKNVLNTLIYSKVNCSKCGTEHYENELDENGVCLICKMKENHPEFQNIENMSQGEMVSLMAKIMIENDNFKANKETKSDDSTAPVKPKRKRRTKAEIEADKKAEEEAKAAAEEIEEETEEIEEKVSEPESVDLDEEEFLDPNDDIEITEN